jgi:hypothetical protein
LPFYWGPLESLGGLDPEEKDGLRRGLRFYDPVSHPVERSLPRPAGEIVEIPVSLPDDEIMLDRMGLDVSCIGDVWAEMAGRALERKEMLILQLHPERILHLQGALKRVLDFACTGGAFWLARMQEIASWWKERTLAEVDIIAVEGGGYRVGLRGPERLGLRLVEPPKATVRPLGSGETVRCSHRPIVGVPEAAPATLINNLRQLGYFYEITSDKDSVGLYLERDVEVNDLEDHIAKCRHPLLADTRWPAPFSAAIAVTGDIDCLTLGDFLRRFWEG